MILHMSNNTIRTLVEHSNIFIVCVHWCVPRGIVNNLTSNN
jgi:hypothetical protein